MNISEDEQEKNNISITLSKPDADRRKDVSIKQGDICM